MQGHIEPEVGATVTAGVRVRVSVRDTVTVRVTGRAMVTVKNMVRDGVRHREPYCPLPTLASDL